MSYLVSCIMPSKRTPEVVEKAIRCFQAQTYGPKELVILRSDKRLNDLYFDSASFGLFDNVLLHQMLPRGMSIGELRNVACRIARGSVLAVLDDDDWSHPDRLTRSMSAIDDGAELVGSSRVVYTDGQRRWKFDGAAFDPVYIPGGTFVLRRRLWEKIGYADVTMGEDTRFLARAYGNDCNVVDLLDATLYQATVSADNTSPKDTSGPGWTIE